MPDARLPSQSHSLRLADPVVHDDGVVRPERVAVHQGALQPPRFLPDSDFFHGDVVVWWPWPAGPYSPGGGRSIGSPRHELRARHLPDDPSIHGRETLMDGLIPAGNFTWTAAGAWGAFLALLGIIVRQVGPWRKQSMDAEKDFRDGLLKRVERLEMQLDFERARHSAIEAVNRHQLNNVNAC